MVKRGPHAPKLLWHVCFSSENTKRPVSCFPGANRTKLPLGPSQKPLAHTSPGRQSWAQIIQQNRGQAGWPGEVCAKGFRKGAKGYFVLSAPGTEETGLFVFSDEKHTCHSNFGTCGPRFTLLNTRNDAPQAQNWSPLGWMSCVFWFLVVLGDPVFSYFLAGFHQARSAFQIAVSRARAVKNILAGPDGSGAPPEPSGPARIFSTARARETAIWNALRACQCVVEAE